MLCRIDGGDFLRAVTPALRAGDPTRVADAVVLRWVPTWHLLTNRRIMDIQGVRTPRVSSLFLTDIAELDASASPPERVVSVGSIAFASEQMPQATRVWRSIPDHLDVHQRIRRAVREARRGVL